MKTSNSFEMTEMSQESIAVFKAEDLKYALKEFRLVLQKSKIDVLTLVLNVFKSKIVLVGS